MIGKRKPVKEKASPLDKFADAADNVPIALYGKHRRAAEAYGEYRAIKAIISEAPTAAEKLVIELGLKPFIEALDKRDAEFFRSLAAHLEKGHRRSQSAQWLAWIARENNSRRRNERPPMTQQQVLALLAKKTGRPASKLKSQLSKLKMKARLPLEKSKRGWKLGRPRRDDF